MFVTTGIKRKGKKFTSLHCWQEPLFIWLLPQKHPGGLWRTFCEEDRTAQCLTLSMFLLLSALVLRKEFRRSSPTSSLTTFNLHGPELLASRPNRWSSFAPHEGRSWRAMGSHLSLEQLSGHSLWCPPTTYYPAPSCPALKRVFHAIRLSGIPLDQTREEGMLSAKGQRINI